MIVWGFIALIVMSLDDSFSEKTIDTILWIMIIIFFIGIAIFVISFVYLGVTEEINYNKQCILVDEINEKRRIKAKKISNSNIVARKQIIADYKPLIKEFDYKVDEVDKILQNFYNMNIIPIQYRNNLAAIQYIYEFMSSTQANYSDMLINVKLEEGIQRLEARLGQIMDHLSKLVYETRCLKNDMNSNIDQIIHKNNQMLSSLEQIETNTYDAALYAELSSNYSKANAYFSMANYLKK